MHVFAIKQMLANESTAGYDVVNKQLNKTGGTMSRIVSAWPMHLRKLRPCKVAKTYSNKCGKGSLSTSDLHYITIAGKGGKSIRRTGMIPSARNLKCWVPGPAAKSMVLRLATVVGSASAS